ncbi:MAG: PAS domain-containing protein [Acidobacteriota bacterium]
MLWLFLLAAVTVLVISLRRVVRRQQPLSDQLYMSKVAVEHVHSGVAWVRAGGQIGSVNQSLANSLGVNPAGLIDQQWLFLFPDCERPRVEEAYAQMLLGGIASLDTFVESKEGAPRAINLRLVAVHDHKMRLEGHHCMIHDESYQQTLERQVMDLTEALSQAGYQLAPQEERDVIEAA